ncbi:MAG: hypothetical protein HZA52_10315 [Planctomycetes bacterium]|nr:hypothetical protein [Planctomycetota bacterium]
MTSSTGRWGSASTPIDAEAAARELAPLTPGIEHARMESGELGRES